MAGNITTSYMHAAAHGVGLVLTIDKVGVAVIVIRGLTIR